jgi:Xaa-Pro aminopeptidase
MTSIRVISASDREDFTNMTRIRELIRAASVDAIVVQSPENVTYFSGFYNMDLAFGDALHFVLWPADGEPVFVTHERGPGFGSIDSFIDDVRLYDAWSGAAENPIPVLHDALLDRGLKGSRIGMELDQLSAADYEDLRELMPDTEFVDCGSLCQEIRMIKTPAEIDHLHWAARMTSRAIQVAYEMARPGDTEKDIADLLGYTIARFGADRVLFNVVASGARTPEGHHFAESVALRPGDIFRVDYGGLFSGYSTDIVRMAVVGKPSQRQSSIYQRVVELQQRMVDRLLPGAIPADLIAQSLREYEDMGLPPDRPMWGHGIGLAVHEKPVFVSSETQPLATNMVLCIEHGWMDRAHNERYHVEDMFLVTENGPRLLSDYANIDRMHIME